MLMIYYLYIQEIMDKFDKTEPTIDFTYELETNNTLPSLIYY